MNSFLLRFVLWATLTTVLAWWIQTPYERAIAGVAARVAAPRGSEIEILDLDVFYPYDLAVYAGLCLASAWAAWRTRGRALAIGLPALVVVEVLALVVSFRALMNAQNPAESERWFNGIVRASGPIASAALWMLLLGRQKLSLAARRWLAD